MLLDMDNKTWFFDAEFAACLMAVAFVAFTLMAGQSMWRSLTPQPIKSTSRSRHMGMQSKQNNTLI
jgi:hypothetical protein